MAPREFPVTDQFLPLCAQIPSLECLIVWHFVQRWIKLSSQVFIKFTFNLFDLNLPLLEPEANKAFAVFFMSNNM